MKALSILQPWAWLIVHAGKDIENRSWATRFRGRVLVHAGKRWGAEQRGDVEHVRMLYPDVALPDRFDLGGIVGAVTIVDCVSASTSRWFFGPFGFVLRDPVAAPEALPFRGALGLFDVPDALTPWAAQQGPRT